MTLADCEQTTISPGLNHSGGAGIRFFQSAAEGGPENLHLVFTEILGVEPFKDILPLFAFGRFVLRLRFQVDLA